MFCKAILSELIYDFAAGRRHGWALSPLLNSSQPGRETHVRSKVRGHFESFSSVVFLNLISEVASSRQNSFFATARLMCFPPPWYCPFVLHNFCHNFPEIVQNSRQRIWNFAKPEFKCIRCILSTDLDYHFVTCFLIWILIVYRDLSETYG